MLRRANEHEAAAFFLVERTMQRTRPRVGLFGLKVLETPDGRIERDPLGRLRFRFDGHGGDYEPENAPPPRPPSQAEVSLWNRVQKTLSEVKPVADPQGNLVSMRLGSRVLSRLPLGSIVAYVPGGTPPFQGSLSTSPSAVRPQTELSRWREAEFFSALEAFLHETGPPAVGVSSLGAPWAPPKPGRQASSIVLATLGHGRRHGRAKLQRCPLCRAPVVKSLFNPRIPYGNLAAGSGSIRDLRGGYLSRLRETYIIADPNSIIPSSAAGTGLVDEPASSFLGRDSDVAAPERFPSRRAP